VLVRQLLHLCKKTLGIPLLFLELNLEHIQTFLLLLEPLYDLGVSVLEMGNVRFGFD